MVGGAKPSTFSRIECLSLSDLPSGDPGEEGGSLGGAVFRSFGIWRIRGGTKCFAVLTQVYLVGLRARGCQICLLGIPVRKADFIQNRDCPVKIDLHTGFVISLPIGTWKCFFIHKVMLSRIALMNLRTTQRMNPLKRWRQPSKPMKINDFSRFRHFPQLGALGGGCVAAPSTSATRDLITLPKCYLSRY